jgi:hypothetical protein
MRVQFPFSLPGMGGITIESKMGAMKQSVAEFKLELQFDPDRRHAGARGANAQVFKPLDQFPNGPAARLSPGEASHDRLPQVDAKGLEFNAFFQRLAVIFSTKGVAHAAILGISFLKKCKNKTL